MAKPAEIVFASLLAAFAPACATEANDIALELHAPDDVPFTLVDTASMRTIKCLEVDVFTRLEIDPHLEEIRADGKTYTFADCGLELDTAALEIRPLRWRENIDRALY